MEQHNLTEMGIALDIHRMVFCVKDNLDTLRDILWDQSFPRVLEHNFTDADIIKMYTIGILVPHRILRNAIDNIKRCLPIWLTPKIFTKYVCESLVGICTEHEMDILMIMFKKFNKYCLTHRLNTVSSGNIVLSTADKMLSCTSDENVSLIRGVIHDKIGCSNLYYYVGNIIQYYETYITEYRTHDDIKEMILYLIEYGISDNEMFAGEKDKAKGSICIKDHVIKFTLLGMDFEIIMKK